MAIPTLRNLFTSPLLTNLSFLLILFTTAVHSLPNPNNQNSIPTLSSLSTNQDAASISHNPNTAVSLNRRSDFVIPPVVAAILPDFQDVGARFLFTAANILGAATFTLFYFDDVHQPMFLNLFTTLLEYVKSISTQPEPTTAIVMRYGKVDVLFSCDGDVKVTYAFMQASLQEELALLKRGIVPKTTSYVWRDLKGVNKICYMAMLL